MIRHIPNPLKIIAKILSVAVIALSFLQVSQSNAGQIVKRSITVDGLKRTYTAVLPDRPRSRASWPVIFAFHPAAAKGGWMWRRTKLHKTPGGNRYVIVYPDGYYPTWNAGDCCGKAHARQINDLKFFNAMRQDINSFIAIDKKVFLTGFSNGARLAYHIMCNQPETVAGVVAVGATRNIDRCKSGAVPLMHIHGADDGGSPVEGGYATGPNASAYEKSVSQDIGYMEPAADIVSLVARRNGCGNGARQAVPKQRTLDTTCIVFTGCGAVSMLCVVPRLGHSWPGAPAGLTKALGPYRPDLNASAEVIGFFNAYR